MARPRVHVVSFGTPEFEGSLCALRQSALQAGADAVHLFSPKDVEPLFAEHPDLLPDSQGYGWWAWKPFLIAKVLDQVPDGDVVVYVDAAALVVSPLEDYVTGMGKDKDITLFRLGEHAVHDRTVGTWTAPSALLRMAAGLVVDPDLLAAQVQVNAAVQMYRAGPLARQFVDEYLRWCCVRGVVAGPAESHRHDQSVLSVLASTYGAHVDVWRDPTQYGDNDPPLGPPLQALLDHHRARLPLVPKVAVITATTGGRHLRACMESVQAQTYLNIEHWVFADGPQCHAAVADIVKDFQGKMPVVPVYLPRNTGADGWNGHRVYGAAPWLVDAPLVSFLDDDNELDPAHVDSLATLLLASEGKAVWAYSLRRIIDQDGAFVVNDTCESLGGLSHTCEGPGDYLVDTSCYLLPRRLAVDVCACWNSRFRAAEEEGRNEADRTVATTLLKNVAWACTRQHTLKYRVGSSPQSVQAGFFLDHDTGHDFASRPDAYVFHFGPAQTAEYFAKLRRRSKVPKSEVPKSEVPKSEVPKSEAYEEWQMTLWRGLESSHNLLNGFSNLANLPRGATCLVVMCHAAELPLDLFAERDDLVKLCYTLESPNIRHQAQWDAAFLAKHFTKVLTYWRPLLADFRVQAAWCPHNTHHLDLDDPLDLAQLRVNRGAGRSACMVLERRDLAGEYAINGVPLKCLDSLREVYVAGLADVTVYGQGWDASPAVLGGRAKLGHALHRSRDPQSNVDIMENYVFNVIVENCDAEGYASEKLYDALAAGCIPLYYGSAPDFVPPDLYVDLREFRDGSELQQFLDSLTDDDVAAWRRRVADSRLDVLRHVSTTAFADAVRGCLAQM